MEDSALALDIHDEVNDAFAPPEKESFEIKTLKDLQWYMGKIESLALRIRQHQEIAASKKQKLKDIYQRELDRIDASFLNETEEYRASLKFMSLKYGHQAYQFSKEHLSTKKGKSFKLGMAVIGTRKKPDDYQIRDRDKVIDWALSNQLDERLLEIETNIKLRELKEFIKSHDEPQIDGVIKIEGKDQFYVEVAGLDLLNLTQTSWTEEPNDTTESNTEGNTVLED